MYAPIYAYIDLHQPHTLTLTAEGVVPKHGIYSVYIYVFVSILVSMCLF